MQANPPSTIGSQHNSISSRPTRFATLLAGVFLGWSTQAADVVWTNIASTANGNWAVASNWRPNKVPTASDHAWITNNGTYTVSLNTTSTVAALTLGGGTGAQTLNLLGPGRLILNGPGLGRTTNGVLQLGGGTLDGTGNFLLNGPLLWMGGTVTGSGVLQFGATSMYKVGGDGHLTGRTLVNAGVLNWFNGTLNTGKGSVISNMPGASLVISNDVSIDTVANSLPGVFLNAGVLRKLRGTAGGVSAIADVFHNAGIVEVVDGRLSFSGGSTNNGSNWVSSGATLVFGGGTNNLTAGSIVTGPGNVLFQQSLTDVYGRFTVGGTNFLKWYGKAVFHRPGLELTVLDVNGAGVSVDFLTGAAVTIETLQLVGGMVGGTDDLIIAGDPLLWNGGGFQGDGFVYCANGGEMNGGNRMDLQGRTLVNLGPFAWNSGMLNTGGGSILSNAPGGVFTMYNDAGGTLYVTDKPPRGTLVNAGLMRKQGAAKVTYFNDPVINLGTMEVQSGWFRCFLPYTNAAGETRLFSGSTFEPRTACHVTGGMLTGSGLVVGNVTNYATVAPGLPVGHLTIEGNYVQTASGVLAIDLGGTATSAYDRLLITAASHSARLNGTVQANLVNGYQPVPNDVFTFLSGPRSGTFASFAHPSRIGMTLEYSANSALMRVTNVAPRPLLSSLTFHWRFTGEDPLGNATWKLHPRLTWPAMAGTLYRVAHTSDVASTNWSMWPDSGPPLFFPSYITATGAVMVVDGPSIGTRYHERFPPSIFETIEPKHFYHVEFGP